MFKRGNEQAWKNSRRNTPILESADIVHLEHLNWSMTQVEKTEKDCMEEVTYKGTGEMT